MLSRLCLFLLLLILATRVSVAQELYFPPLSGDEWEITAPTEAGLCADGIDSLFGYLAEVNTKAFILLQDGKIVLEEYFGNFEQDSLWYWASAGKSLTAFAVGLAQDQGWLEIDEPSQIYLGEGWSSLTNEQEQQITIRHHLTMTTGLDDDIQDSDCTLDTCLQYLTDPGTRWAYHNAPYTLLDGVIAGSTGQNLNGFLNSALKTKIGMNGFFFPLEYNNVFFSTPRSMARFGLLVLNEGTWDGTAVMEDTTYFNAMTNTSQDLNKSYGYLWWLNGKESFMVPGLQVQFPGSLSPSAPPDMFAALGKNGQILCVVPSRNLVLVRMGNAASADAITVGMLDDIWSHLNAAYCTSTTAKPERSPGWAHIYPNPASTYLRIESDLPVREAYLIGSGGQIQKVDPTQRIDISRLAAGVYLIRLETDNKSALLRVIVN